MALLSALWKIVLKMFSVVAAQWLTGDAGDVDAALAVPEGGEPGVDHVGLGQRADVAVQGGPLRTQHARQIRVGQPVADDALHQRATVIVLYVADPLRTRTQNHQFCCGKQLLTEPLMYITHHHVYHPLCTHMGMSVLLERMATSRLCLRMRLAAQIPAAWLHRMSMQVSGYVQSSRSIADMDAGVK